MGKFIATIFIFVAAGLLANTALAEQHTLSDSDIAAMAGNRYASGELPLGDKHYVTNGPRKGYIYLCHVMGGGGGAERKGGWIHESSWNILQKISVQGQVSWPDATFNNFVEGDKRILSSNGLPVNQFTGIFPVQSSDPAYAMDRNPNTIRPQSLHDELPFHPTYLDTPQCMGGEVGIMLNGVPLFNGFDAGMRDAAAHEVQDACGGHPQRTGEYHYHSLSPCIKDIGEKTVIGYALDGFPITGPLVAPDKYLTTNDLDECHGITSEIIEDGHKIISYHYVMTQDFPYSVSCFRGMPVRIGPSDMPKDQNMTLPKGGAPPGGSGHRPPHEALDACDGMNDGDSCSFISPHGDTISGECHAPPNVPRACIPMRTPQ